VLAGFLSSAELWEQFSDEWQAICERDPKTLDFHMAKAFRLKEYRWREEQRDTRIRELVDLIIKKALYRVDCNMIRPVYDLIVKGRIPPEIDSPYFVLFYNIIISIAEFMDHTNLEGTVDWVFDDQGPIGAECVRWYEWIRDHARPEVKRRLGSTPIFRHDKDVLPLKAADIFAWHVRRYVSQEQLTKLEHNIILSYILCNIPGSSCIIQPEDLSRFVLDIKNGITFHSRARFLWKKDDSP